MIRNTMAHAQADYENHMKVYSGKPDEEDGN